MPAMADYVLFVSPCNFSKLFKYLEKPEGQKALVMRTYLEDPTNQKYLRIPESSEKLGRRLPGWNTARLSKVVSDLQTLRKVSITLYALTCIMQHLSNAV